MRGLTVYRGGVEALSDVSFTASREFVLVGGPNGAGKTTLFLAILGVLPYKGEVCVDDVCDEGRRRKIGYVPQILKPEAQATVWEYVYLPAKFRNGRRAKEAAEEALRVVGMLELRDRPIGALSGGQLQRAAVARALAVGGDVLLLDEPLSNVDPQGRVELIGLLRDLKSDRTILMTSHELTMPIALADKVLLLNKRVVAYGTPDEVLREEVLRRIYSFVRVARVGAGYVCVTEDYAHPH